MDGMDLPSFDPPLYQSYDGNVHICECEGDLVIYASAAWRKALVKALKDSLDSGYAVVNTEPPGREGEPRYPKAIVILGIEALGKAMPKRTLPKGYIPE